MFDTSNFNRLGQIVAQTVMDHPEINTAQHKYACAKIGIEPREFVDSDEDEPWYPAYWLHVIAYQSLLMNRVQMILMGDPCMYPRD